MSTVLELKAKCVHGWTGSPSRCGKCRSEKRKAERANIPDGRKKVVLTENGRTCLKCGEAKSWDEFAKDRHGFNQKTATCKECRNKYGRETWPDKRGGSNIARPDKLKRLYGITYEDVLNAFSMQDGKCANSTCKKPISLEVKGVGGNRAVIDHNHSTGEFRALLCSSCNTILGTIETKEEIILGLVAYRNKYNARTKDD